MAEIKLAIKGYEGYCVIDGKVFSKKGNKFLKPDYENRVRLYKKGSYRDYTVGKLVFCAQRGIDPSEIPNGYEFILMEDSAVVKDKSSACRERALQRVVEIGRVMDDYRQMYDFTRLMLDYINDETKDADTVSKRLYETIYEYRDDIIKYARYTLKLPKSVSIDYADKGIELCVSRMVNLRLCISNPIGYIKRSVRGMMLRERCVRMLQLDENKI